MHVKKDEQKNTWEVFLYVENFQGEKKLKHKRGFRTKKDAIAWAEQFKLKGKSDLNMTFQSLWELYKDDMSQRLRENTIQTKSYIVELKILPYFSKRKVSEITASNIRNWQNQLMKKGYSQTYLKTINNQLSAIFNYAVRYYDLPKNPCIQAGSIGKGKADEMNFWTKEEFDAFIVCIEDKPQFNIAFKTLYWTGCRLGELLALVISDIDFENKTLNISKSYQRIKGRDVITEPKTEKSKRIITLPDFLVEELREYVSQLYGLVGTDRLFHVTKHSLAYELKRGAEIAGVKAIRIHDLRHSHVSLLISRLGMQPNLVAQRLGHENIKTTLNTYSHLYPNQMRDLANQLDDINRKMNEQKEKKE